MLFKLAFNNVKKNIKEYMLYFITLVIAVSVFYGFQAECYYDKTIEMTDFISISNTLGKNILFVSVIAVVVFGIIIVYADTSLICKRKREFGVYKALGMSKNKITLLIIMETTFAAVAALICGVLAGMIISQFLSLFTFKFLGYKFDMDMLILFSSKAFLKTLLFFIAITAVTVTVNILIIHMVKTKDLLDGGIKVKKAMDEMLVVKCVLFVIALILIIIECKMILSLPTEEIRQSYDSGKAAVAGVIGTILLFAAVKGVILSFVQNNKQSYFKGLNAFFISTIRNTSHRRYMLMAVSTIMIILSLVGMSSILSRSIGNTKALEGNNQYDATPFTYFAKQEKYLSVSEIFDIIGVKLSDGDRIVYFNTYNKYRKNHDEDYTSSEIDPLKMQFVDYSFIKWSDYNKIREFRGEEPIELNDNEIIIFCPKPEDLKLDDGSSIDVDNNMVDILGTKYHIKYDMVVKDVIQNTFGPDGVYMVINDDFCDLRTIHESSAIIDFKDGLEREREYVLRKKVESYFKDRPEQWDKIGLLDSRTRNGMLEDIGRSCVWGLLPALYLLIVVLISSLSLMFIQQFSDTMSSIKDYEILLKLGNKTKSIYKIIFKQTTMYFGIPFIIILVQAIPWIDLVCREGYSYTYLSGKGSFAEVFGSILGVFTLIYMIYFFLTYAGCKKIVRNKLNVN